MERKRQSNIELLRIVAMLMIIGFHLAANGVLLCYDSSLDRLQTYSEGSIFNKVFNGLLMPGGHIGVGIFFAITGYFLVMASKINYTKIFVTVRFYAFLLSIVALSCLLCGYSFPGLSIYGVLSSVVLCLTVPALGDVWWFVTAYVILLFLAPAINNIMKPEGNYMVDNQINTRRGGGCFTTCLDFRLWHKLVSWYKYL